MRRVLLNLLGTTLPALNMECIQSRGKIFLLRIGNMKTHGCRSKNNSQRKKLIYGSSSTCYLRIMSFFIKGLPNTRYISPHCIHDTCFSQAPLHPLYRIQFAFEISPFKSSSNMQITTAALVLFAAIGAVASPVESLSGDILIKFDGVSISSYLMFS